MGDYERRKQAVQVLKGHSAVNTSILWKNMASVIIAIVIFNVYLLAEAQSKLSFCFSFPACSMTSERLRSFRRSSLTPELTPRSHSHNINMGEHQTQPGGTAAPHLATCVLQYHHTRHVVTSSLENDPVLPL